VEEGRNVRRCCFLREMEFDSFAFRPPFKRAREEPIAENAEIKIVYRNAWLLVLT
jgi:hypothetical protein